MSYILEALKKLEQKRRREEGTHLLSDQHPAALHRKRRQFWPFLLFFALLLNAGFLLWWLSPWPQPQPRRSALQSRETIEEDPRANALSGQEDKRDGSTALPASSSGISMPPARENIANETPPPAVAPDADLHPTEPQQPQKRDLTPGQRAIGINELPPSLRTALPDLTISGHFFDAIPSSRVVIIGGRTLHEGQAVSPGLKLEQITRDGVVFSYQGYRFREGVF